MRGIRVCDSENISILNTQRLKSRTSSQVIIAKNLGKSFYQAVFNIRSITLVLLITVIYVAIPLYLLNYRLLLSVELGSFPIFYKLDTLLLLLEGLPSVFPTLDAVLLVINGILVGINIVLLINVMKKVKKNKSGIKLVIGVAVY